MSCFDSDLFKDQTKIQEEIFRCLVTGEVLNDPVIDECGHTFCKGCLKELYNSDDSSCPLSREPIDLCLSVPNLTVKRMIDGLEIRCFNSSKGCVWEGKVSEMDGHIAVCEYQFVTCTRKCGLWFVRKDLDAHAETCLRRMVDCENCKKNLPYNIYINNHLPRDCPEIVIMCPNKCGLKTKRNIVQTHLGGACPNKMVRCCFNEVGCKFMTRQKNLKSHNQNCLGYHSTLANTHKNNQYSKISPILETISAHIKKPTFERQHLMKEQLDLMNVIRLSDCATRLVSPREHEYVKFIRPNFAHLKNYDKLVCLNGLDKFQPFNDVMVRFTIKDQKEEGFSVAIGLMSDGLRQTVGEIYDYDSVNSGEMILFKDIDNEAPDKVQFRNGDYVSIYIDTWNSKIIFQNWTTEYMRELPLPQWNNFWPVFVIGPDCMVEGSHCLNAKF